MTESGCNGKLLFKEVVHQHQDGLWHFYDETWDCFPRAYPSKNVALKAYNEYAETL